jgi:rare lipoprotein A
MRTLSTVLALMMPYHTAETVPPKVTVSPQTGLHRGLVYQKGMASWYGKENRKSSTGKILKHKTPGLAHKTLPIGTYVKITSLRTNRTVMAVVEDRGPYKKNRIVDLNYPAAKQLGILKDGITNVQVEIIR